MSGLVCLGDGVDGGGGRGGESGGSVLVEGAWPSNVRSVISAVPALVSSIIALSIWKLEKLKILNEIVGLLK